MKKHVQRLLTNKWQIAAFGFASIAIISLVPKWLCHPDPHWLVLLIHDLSVALGLVFAVLAYYFAQRIFVSTSPPRPGEGRDGDIHFQREE